MNNELSGITYRFASLADCALLGMMNHQLIADERHRNPMSVNELAERMHDWLASGNYSAVLFEHNSDVVAYGLYRIESDSGVYLRQFFVCREYRRHGIGSKAVNILFREVWPKKVRLTIDVLSANEVGWRFWSAVGFRNYSMTMERFNDASTC